jgi:hypothetical protein
MQHATKTDNKAAHLANLRAVNLTLSDRLATHQRTLRRAGGAAQSAISYAAFESARIRAAMDELEYAQEAFEKE